MSTPPVGYGTLYLLPSPPPRYQQLEIMRSVEIVLLQE